MKYSRLLDLNKGAVQTLNFEMIKKFTLIINIHSLGL
jgi:hypothetical protein